MCADCLKRSTAEKKDPLHFGDVVVNVGERA